MFSSSTTPRRERKRKRGIDPPPDGAQPPSAERRVENGAKKRNRLRGAATDGGTAINGRSNLERPRKTQPVGQNGNLEQSSARSDNLDNHSRSNRELVGRNRAANNIRRESSTVSQIPFDLVQAKKTSPTQLPSPSDDSSTTVDAGASNNYVHNSMEEDDDCKYHTVQKASGRWVKFMIGMCFVVNALALMSLSSVLYTLDFDYKLNNLKTNSLHLTAMQKYSYHLDESEERNEQLQRKLSEFQQSNVHLKETMAHLENEHTSQIEEYDRTVLLLQTSLKESQLSSTNMKDAMDLMESEHMAQIEEYKSIFEQHDKDLNEALSRMKVLRGDEYDKMSALDLAWLRMDELLEENNELSHHLNEAKKQQLFVARDRELINTVESLTQQLKIVSEEKDNLNVVINDLKNLLAKLNTDYELLEFTHIHMTNMFFSPILTYVQSLQHTSEQQHAIIMELTSLVHSLQASLDLSESDALNQFTESEYAVDAIASAAGAMVSQQAAQYEMERSMYMERMEEKLSRMEDEAQGAVQAVAEAAGKLEYERKVEEETRWRSYVEEVERTLGGIGAQMEHDLHNHGESREGSLKEELRDKNDVWNDNQDLLQDAIETSVLRAAITRKIEEGITSLRKYIHPYNYVREKKQMHPWESISDSENEP